MENGFAFPRNSIIPRFAFRVLFLVSSVFAQFAVDKINISVLAPKELQEKQEGSPGKFGFPSDGGSMVGSVIYPENKALGCQPFEGYKPFKSDPCLPTILLLDRGECLFELKAWHAQLAGASAVLVIDDRDEPLPIMYSPERTKSEERFIKKINIPFALVTKRFGDKLKETYRNGDYVLAKIDWLTSYPAVLSDVPEEKQDIIPPAQEEMDDPGMHALQ